LQEQAGGEINDGKDEDWIDDADDGTGDEPKKDNEKMEE